MRAAPEPDAQVERDFFVPRWLSAHGLAEPATPVAADARAAPPEPSPPPPPPPPRVR
jgi:hypothetical protein